MKGLFLKDIYSVRQLFKGLALLILFYTVLGVYMASSGFIVFIVVFLGSSVFFQVFNCDKSGDWDKYVYALPVSKRLAITVRYIFGCFVISASVFLSALIILIIQIFKGNQTLGESGVMLLAGVAVLCIMMDLLFPLLYKFGVEKGRMVFIGIFILAFLIFTTTGKLYVPSNEANINPSQVILGVFLIVVVALLSLLPSAYCSLKIIEKKINKD